MALRELTERPPAEPCTTGGPGILLADEAAAVRTCLGETLRRAGFTVWVAPDGAQALDVYRRHGADIALVVLGRHLPGLDGPQTLEALRAINAEVRCCFLAAADDADALLERGDASVLHKPMEPDKIAGILRGMAEAGGMRSMPYDRARVP